MRMLAHSRRQAPITWVLIERGKAIEARARSRSSSSGIGTFAATHRPPAWMLGLTSNRQNRTLASLGFRSSQGTRSADADQEKAACVHDQICIDPVVLLPAC